MSATRLILRLFLVAVLIGMCVLIVQAWRGSQPDVMLARAEAALSAGRPEDAKLHLQRMTSRFPDNIDAQRLLAKALLEEARKENPSASYATTPAARAALIEAADADPKNIELQKEVLRVFVQSERPAEAGVYATRILEQEPNNVDALYAQASNSVKHKSGKAAQQLEKLMEMDNGRKFQVYLRAAGYYVQMKNNEALQSVLTRACDDAGALTTEDVAKMPRLESHAMSQLLKSGVASADDAGIALRRANQAIDALEKFDLSVKEVLADVAEISSEIMLGLRQRHPAAQDTSEQKTARAQLQARVDGLRVKSVEAQIASPLVMRESAYAAFIAGDHEKAAAILRQGLEAAEKMKPAPRAEDVLELHLLAARNYLVMHKHREAQPHLDALLKHEKYAGWGELLSGGVASSQGRYERAYQHFLQAEKRLGSILFVHMGLANTCLSLGKWNEALRHLQALHQSFGNADVELRAWAAQQEISTANVHFGEFRAYLALNQWEKARGKLSSLAGTSLERRAAALAIAYLWSKSQREQALAMLSEARKKAPDDLTLLQMEAAFQQQLGKVDSARQIIADAAAAQPGNLSLQMVHAQWLLRQRMTDEALTLLTKIEEDFPAENGPKVLRAYALLQTGKLEETIAAATKLKEDPKTAAAASFLIAAAEMRQKDPEAASAELAAAAERAPNHGVISLLQGEVAAAQGDYAEAIDNLSSTLDVVPIRAQARSMLLRSILMLSVEKGPAEADAKLTPLVKAHPEDPFLLIVMADLKFKQGQFDVAMELLDRAEQLEPGKANVPYIKSSIWLQRMRIPTAYSEVQRALSIDPGHLPSRMLAAELAGVQGRHQEAFDHAKEVLARVPKHVPMLMTQANSLARMSRAAEAMQLLTSAIEENPKANALYDQLMAIQYDAGQKDAALATIRKGRAELPDDSALAADEVMLLCRADKLDDAQRVAKEFTRDHTEPERFLALAQAFFRSQQFDAARDWGGQALALADDKVKPAIHLFLGDVSLSEYETSAKKDREILLKARDHFAAVLAAHPTHFIAGNNLAWILATSLDQAQEAAEVIDRVRGKATVEQMPINFIDTVAVVYRKANRLEEAQQVLERATAMYEENSLLLYQLATVQHDRKLYAAARTSLERAIQLGVPDKYREDAQRLLSELRQQTETPTSTANAAN